jgi:protein-disulfide isomerase
MSSRQAEKEKARAERIAREEAEAAQQRRKRRTWIFGGAGLVAVVLVLAAVVVSSTGGGGSTPRNSKAPLQGVSDANNMFAGIQQHGTVLGNPLAPVSFTEFADLKCPICREYALSNSFPTLVAKYVKTGKMKMDVQFQTFVGDQFNPGDSARAARFALAAAMQNKMWQFFDLFYRNQQDETTRYVSDAYLRKLGAAIPGLNVAKAMRDRNSASITNQLTQASQKFSQNGFTGTPSFLVGKTGGSMSPINYSNFDPQTFTGPINTLLGQ